MLPTPGQATRWVKVASADAGDKPRILTNSLEDPDDVWSMIAGMRLAKKIAGTNR